MCNLVEETRDRLKGSRVKLLCLMRFAESLVEEQLPVS
jgi:hypothetical protein